MSPGQPSLPRKCLAEFVGTYLLVLLGCGVVHASVLTGAQSGLWQVAIVWGIAIMLASYTVGAISGAHINPAMTLAFAVWGRISWGSVVPYIVAQTTGAFLAAATLFVLFNPYLAAREHDKGVVRGAAGSEITAMCYGEYFPSPGPLSNSEGPYSLQAHERLNAFVSESTAFLAELLGTLILALVVFAVTDDRNAGAPAAGFAPVFIGLTVATLISVIAPLTQACFNPARDFGPRLFACFAGWGSIALPGPRGNGFLTVYIIAPILGAIIGAGLHVRLLRTRGSAIPVVVLILAALASFSTQARAAEFDQFVDDYFDARFTERPSEATGVGLHQYDQKLEDLSRPKIEGRIVAQKRWLARLDAIDRAKLSADNAIDARILDGQIRAELLDLETLRYWEVNPMLYAGLPGPAIDGLIKRDFAPAAERLRSVIARERAIPAVFDAARANLKTPPKEFTDLALRMAKGSVGFFEGPVATWAKDAAGKDAAVLKEFDAANARVVASFKAFVAWLESDLKPRSNGQYAIGAENFLLKLKFEELVEIPLPRLLARGEAQLEKDHAAFVATARQIDPGKSPAEVMKALSDDHPTADDLIPSVRRSVDAARRYLIAKGIVTIPSEVRPRIEETPPYARSGSFASMDTPGPYETKATEAFYYVTPVEKDWDAKHAEEHLRLYNPPVVAMINVHEAYPGHYLQFLYAPRFPSRTRKLTGCGTNVEGWAHYCEQMMVDEGFGDGDPKIRLAQLQEALLRDARYVVGIKLHTEGWTVEEGTQLFVEKAFQEAANAYEESRRGAYNPTYLYYTLGKLQIQELRDEYLAKKPGTTLRQFHDAFVTQGGLPVRLVREILLK